MIILAHWDITGTLRMNKESEGPKGSILSGFNLVGMATEESQICA